jgi:hypothetical protein
LPLLNSISVIPRTTKQLLDGERIMNAVCFYVVKDQIKYKLGIDMKDGSRELVRQPSEWC